MKVFIWFSEDNYFGHASLTLNNDTHISWWPSNDESGKRKKGMQISAPPRPNQTYNDDVSMEGRQPDKTHTISNLDEAKIQKWWDTYRQEKTEWNVIYRNCCNVVYKALVSGGAQPKMNLWWEPKDIDNYCDDIFSR